MRIPPLAPIIIALCLSLGSGYGFAGETQAAEEQGPGLTEICKTTKCREPGAFKLRTEEGEQELELPGLPYVYAGHVYVFPGDEFDIELDFAEDGKATIALPGETPRPGHTIHVSFSQMEGKQDMLLSLRNGTKATVKYDAFMVVPNRRPVYTSSCPLLPGLAGLEHWPHAVVQLLLTNFRKLEEPGKTDSGETTITCQ